MPRTGAVEVRPANRQGSQPKAVRPPTQGPVTRPLTAQRPTTVLRPGITQGPSGIPPPAKKGTTVIPRPATMRGPATALAGGRNIPATVPSSVSPRPQEARAVEARPIDCQGSQCQAVRSPTQGSTDALRPATTQASTFVPPPPTKEATAGLRSATSQGPSTGSKLNPAAKVFVPGAKGHKTPASPAGAAAVVTPAPTAADVTPAANKKVPTPPNAVAAGRRISAVRPDSARSAAVSRPRAMEVRPINRPFVSHQESRAEAKEVRPIGRQGSKAATFIQPPRRRSQPLPRLPNMQGMPILPHCAPLQGYPFAPAVTPMQGYPTSPVVIPTQGHPAPPEFQPVPPMVPKGRVYPWAHLFNGETPHEQVWPRTFGPGQPHTAAIIRRLQDQEFLPRPGWWAWLEFEDCYHQMPFN